MIGIRLLYFAMPSVSARTQIVLMYYIIFISFALGVWGGQNGIWSLW